MTLLFIPHPVTVIVNVFIIVVFSKAMLLPIHPFSIVDFLLLCLAASWLSKKNSHSVFLILLELSSILKVLLIKVIYAISFDHFASPSPNVHISIRKCILFLHQLTILVILGLIRDSLSSLFIWVLIGAHKYLLFLFFS